MKAETQLTETRDGIATPKWKAEKMTSKKSRRAGASEHTEYYKITMNGNNIACYLTKEDAKFIVAAREGWSEANNRAITAEQQLAEAQVDNVAMLQAFRSIHSHIHQHNSPFSSEFIDEVITNTKGNMCSAAALLAELEQLRKMRDTAEATDRTYKAELSVARLTEENDIQRASIQELSQQLVGAQADITVMRQALYKLGAEGQFISDTWLHELKARMEYANSILSECYGAAFL